MAKSYPDTIEFIETEKLLFDPKNPRLPSNIVKGKDKYEYERKVVNWMLSDAAILELMGSIGEKGFFPAEPLLVVKSKDEPGKFEVVEGNRRLTAAKLLKYPELADKRKSTIKMIISEAKETPSKLPAFVFDKRELILDYLGFKHITGVKPWSALAKAKYLKDLQKEYKTLPIDEQFKNLAKAIGSRSDYVRDLLVGLRIYEKISENDYFDIDNLNEETIDFGVYYTALSRTNIPKFLGVDRNSNNPISNINIQNLKDFTEWVSKKNSQNATRLGDSRNLTKLSEILAIPKALAAFKEGKSLDEALMYTEEPEKLFQNSVIESLAKLTLANTYFHRVDKGENSDYENLREIYSICENLLLLLTKKLSTKK